jgi:hypothetical protein
MRLRNLIYDLVLQLRVDISYFMCAVGHTLMCAIGLADEREREKVGVEYGDSSTVTFVTSDKAASIEVKYLD